MTILLNSTLSAQTQNHFWTVPDKFVFFNQSPQVITNSNFTGNTSSSSYNAIQDANNNLLFCVIDGFIYDADGNFIDQIINPYSISFATVTGYPEVCIVPVPGSCSKYYIIAASYSTGFSVGSNPKPFYVTLDMSLVNPANTSGISYGSLIGTNPTILDQGVNLSVHNGSMHLAVSRFRPATQDRLLFVTDNSNLYSFPITANGIGNGTVICALSSGLNSSPFPSELELYEDLSGNYKIACVSNGPQSPTTKSLGIYDLNSTGSFINISLFPLLVDDFFKGVEFSPGGNIVYLTNTVSPFIQYVDITIPNSSAQTLTQVTNAIDFQDTQIELAPDGKLYFAAAHRLASLDGSNNPGTATWNDQALTIDVPLTTINTVQVRVLGDQIDGENYSSILNATSTDAFCCDHLHDWNQDIYMASGTSIWTGAANPLNGGTGNIAWIKGTLSIPTNADITIQGMTLHFGLNGKIRIEPGGKLTIDGTTLTGNNTCQNMWLGIEVIGTGNTNFPNINQQGQFISKNFSTIEQALTGIENGSFYLPSTNDFGGYISCSRTTFNNCNYGLVMIGSVNNANYSCNIESCTFTGSALWYPNQGAIPTTHVVLFGVKGGLSAGAGVDIYFSNLSPGTYRTSFLNATNGIGCLNTERINLLDANFINCNTAVTVARLSNSASPTSTLLSGLTFTNCYTSIKLAGSLGEVIRDNTFNVSNGSQDINFYGIYSDAASDFTINDNLFKHLKYGIWCKNSGSIGGRINSNHTGNLFNECWRGIDCRGDNGNLLINCNTFNNIIQPTSEFSTAWYVGGEMANQGSASCPNCPAGNEFFRSGNRKDLYSKISQHPSCNLKNFCYYPYSSPPECTPLVYTPLTIGVIQTLISKSPASCIGRKLMLESGYNPDSAQLMIESQNDSTVKQLWVNELISWYQQMDLETDAAYYLKHRYDEASKELLFPIYLKIGDIIDAQHLLDNYCSLPDEKSMAFCALNTIILNWKMNDVSPFDMSEEERERITTIANGLTPSAPKAQALLKMVYSEEINPWEPSDTIEARMARPDDEIPEIDQFQINPNPALGSSVFIINSNRSEEITQSLIRIYDISMKIKFEINFKFNEENTFELPLTSLNSGIYFVELKINDSHSQFKKLVVEK